MKRKRWTYDEIYSYILEENYKLISRKEDIVEKNGYVKLKTKLSIQCKNSHIYNATFDSFKRGCRCNKCSRAVGKNKKYDINDFKKEAEKYNYKLIDNVYVNCEYPLLLICPNDHQWKVSFSNFKAGYRCPQCNKKLKNSMLLEDTIKKLSEHNYKFLNIEESADFFTDSMLTIECENGHIYNSKLNNVRNGRKCPICNGKSKKTLDDAISLFKQNKYRVISHDGYNNNQSIFSVECPNGHIYNTTYANFKSGSRCLECANKKKVHSYEYVKNYIDNIVGYKLIGGNYENNLSKLEIECNRGHIYKTSFSTLLQGGRCPICNTLSRRIEVSEIKRRLSAFGYTLNGVDYKNGECHIDINCFNGHNYVTTLDIFTQGGRCPYCNQSLGESRIASFFYNKNIDYVIEYKYEDCKFKKALPFDFYLQQYNTLIEYDGEHHYFPIDFANKGYEWALDNFISTKIRDTIKNEYCKNNNIKLIRIPYWDFNNIEKILCKELNIKLRRKGNKQLK